MKPRFRTARSLMHRLLRSKTVTLDGVRIDARETAIGPDVRDQLLRGDYEYAERRLLRDLLRPGDRVVEMGAGIGAVGLLAAKIVGAQNVWSYEANPALRQVIEGNHARNDLHPGLDMRGVTSDGGPVTFFVTDVMLSSSLSRRDTAREVEVEGVAIADVLRERCPTVLVLDVEGAETTLLPGAPLDGVRALLVETHANVTGQSAIDEMIAALAAQGFRIARRAHRNLVFER